MSISLSRPQAALRQARAQVQQRWQQLAKREQQALAGLAGFLLLSSAYSLVWQPQQQGLYLAQQQWRNAALQHSQLAQLPVEVGQAPAAVVASELPGLLARSSQQAGLDLQRLDHEAPGRLSLSLEGELAALIPWLDQLELRQVQVLTLSLEVNAAGLAHALLQVQSLND